MGRVFPVRSGTTQVLFFRLDGDAEPTKSGVIGKVQRGIVVPAGSSFFYLFSDWNVWGDKMAFFS